MTLFIYIVLFMSSSPWEANIIPSGSCCKLHRAIPRLLMETLARVEGYPAEE